MSLGQGGVGANNGAAPPSVYTPVAPPPSGMAPPAMLQQIADNTAQQPPQPTPMAVKAPVMPNGGFPAPAQPAASGTAPIPAGALAKALRSRGAQY